MFGLAGGQTRFGCRGSSIDPKSMGGVELYWNTETLEEGMKDRGDFNSCKVVTRF